MQGQNIFGNEKEIKRLEVQNRLFSELEKPLILRLFSGKSGLSVLDIGCNNGAKAFGLFSHDMFSRVIGVDCDAELIEKADKAYDSQKFSFYKADIESPEFAEVFNIQQFDIIYISFVLMHLRDPKALIVRLKSLLKPDGVLIVTEGNDGISDISPCGAELLRGALEILKKDKYAGNRETGKTLPDILSKCGYSDTETLCEYISAKAEDKEKKEDIFTTFFPIFPIMLSFYLKKTPKTPNILLFPIGCRKITKVCTALLPIIKPKLKWGLKLQPAKESSDYKWKTE